MKLLFTTVRDDDGRVWFYITINGQLDRFGYSTRAAALQRYVTIRDGWI